MIYTLTATDGHLIRFDRFDKFAFAVVAVLTPICPQANCVRNSASGVSTQATSLVDSRGSFWGRRQLQLCNTTVIVRGGEVDFGIAATTGRWYG